MPAASLKDKAYGIIKDKILRCEYLPGQILVESEIIETVGASRTPIREALNKLEQERLVRIVSKRGVFVSEITVSTVCDVYDVRELVEPYFVERYAPMVPQERIERLFQELDQLEAENPASTDQYYAFDNDLHLLFARYDSNSYLQIMMEQIYAQNNRIRILSGRASSSRLKASQEEHRHIVDALARKDYALGALAMKKHLQMARDAALDAITKKNNVFFSVE